MSLLDGSKQARAGANTPLTVRTTLTTSPEEAAAFIRRGELAAFPTETVYGLGADAFSERAVRAIFEAKGRPADNPLIVHLAAVDEIRRVAAEVPEAAQALIETFFPGPLTLVLPRAEGLPDVVTAGLETVGVRMPQHPVARAFLEKCRTPVAAPSANRSGRPSPTTWRAVEDDLGGRISCILRAGRATAGLESTVVDCTAGAAPVVLRAGVVTLKALRTAWPAVRLASTDAPESARSPGTRHRHYAPDAAVCLVDDPREAAPGAAHAYIGLDAPRDAGAFGHVLICGDVETYAHALFHFFREAERRGCTRIYGQRVRGEGLGRALMDRLTRAAAS